jgi:monoamine oxidase
LAGGRVYTLRAPHTSLERGWIQGAIESGIRAAHEVNNLPGVSFRA